MSAAQLPGAVRPALAAMARNDAKGERMNRLSIHRVILWGVLLLFAAWTLALMFTYVGYRVALVLAMKKKADSWGRDDKTDDPAFIVRAKHAHLNALENLFTDAWERGDSVAARDYARRGLAAARAAGGVVDRWLWFEDRLLWAPSGFGG